MTDFPTDELRDPQTGELVSTTARYRSGTSARLIQSADFDLAAPLSCSSCAWEGTGKTAEVETHSEVADVSCPKCGVMLVVVSY